MKIVSRLSQPNSTLSKRFVVSITAKAVDHTHVQHINIWPIYWIFMRSNREATLSTQSKKEYKHITESKFKHLLSCERKRIEKRPQTNIMERQLYTWNWVLPLVMRKITKLCHLKPKMLFNLQKKNTQREKVLLEYSDAFPYINAMRNTVKLFWGWPSSICPKCCVSQYVSLKFV